MQERNGRPVVEPRDLFIGGEWRAARSGARRTIEDPSTGKEVTTVAEAGKEDVDAAVGAARSAFEEGPWGRMPARERARTLLRVAELIRRRTDDLVAVECVNVGKPVTICRAVDVPTAAETFEYYAALAQSSEGAARQTPLPVHAYTRREPYGVVGAITPFNFPLILFSSKVAPALAAGNTVVHKPADETPLSALLMAEILTEAGLPPGALNVVTGSGPVAGEALLTHPGVDKLTFTGSSAIGRHTATRAGEGLKPVTLELGGNGAHIVFEDADLERAVDAAIRGFVFNTGQFCMSGARLLVHHSIYDAVLEPLVKAVSAVPVGDPFDPATVLGPMAGERHRAKVEKYVDLAKEQGGRVLTGGERLDLDGGYYYPPTVIADLPGDSPVVREEIFGPVLTVHSFKDDEEAVAMANGTPYGLAAGLHTRDVARAHRVAARLRAGIVWVNDWAMLDPSMPFGGVGLSGYGRENGPEGLEAYTRTKSVIISLA